MEELIKFVKSVSEEYDRWEEGNDQNTWSIDDPHNYLEHVLCRAKDVYEKYLEEISDEGK